MSCVAFRLQCGLLCWVLGESDVGATALSEADLLTNED